MTLSHIAAGVAAALSLACSVPALAGNPQLAAIEGARANMQVLETRHIRAEGFDYDHAVTIALPASYHVQPGRSYPVLWVLDDALMTRMAVGLVDVLVGGNKVPEMIVVGVGSPAEDGLPGVGRRIMDYSPGGEQFFPEGPANDIAPISGYPQRADDFLAFLVDDLRPVLASEFRMSGQDVLHGHSLGGMLGGYALFARPDAFDAMVLGSPAMMNLEAAPLRAEAAYAQDGNRSLDVDLFVGVGGEEADDWFLAASRIVSGTARFVETLHARDYEGLEVESRFYTGKDHFTVAPRVLMDGLAWLYRDEAEQLGSSWPEPTD
ncbi:alpha/beta hydrolase [Aurantiacibacter poecillastricola]|uniref:alpha/beta hydrolase n=1 Tax=Aurantiacibacter poecillastricola TaxID=3064385 RepID=UPI00273D2AEA|nr:alpha/beta hydrolase-fold protein [Aurantiacibacter sp. 219JJ12-13]MDP5262532.1 alpha/beta hydrolase-fold protein [Aurantiacibacter sp. 219JJ12-13]